MGGECGRLVECFATWRLHLMLTFDWLVELHFQKVIREQRADYNVKLAVKQP